MNIWSGSNDPLCAALTHPTEISRRKGKISRAYPIRDLEGRAWPDAEAVYKAYCRGRPLDDAIDTMSRVNAMKFRQYPELVEAVRERGGSVWLRSCTHHVYGKSRWEGAGMDSPFIRCLVAAYEAVA